MQEFILPSNKNRLRLRDVIDQTVIICYKEDVSELRKALAREGLKPVIHRASYSDEEMKFPANTRTFISHFRAWQHAKEHSGYTAICEADFVPCIGLGDCQAFWPVSNAFAWAYLYQGSPRLLALKDQCLRGHCAPLVAYVINSTVAEIFSQYYDHEMREYDPTSYFNFDAHLQWWSMGRGAEAYIPLHHCGEHGGFPNQEHRRFGRLSRSGRHRADNLAGKLAFLPQYAKGSYFRFLAERVEARLLGWARLLSGRWIVKTNVYKLTARDLIAMYLIGVYRLLPASWVCIWRGWRQ